MIELTAEQLKVQNDLLAWVDDFYAGKTDQPFTTMAGLAGTGKTTLLGFLAAELRQRRAYTRIGFITYTGKASIVLGSKLTELGPDDFVGTIHSLIYYPMTDENTGKIIGWSLKDYLDVDFIIVDEASMVGKDIWKDLLAYNVPIICIGDHGQLPPVGSHDFNLMDDPDFILTEIHRQALDNPIIKLSMTAREEGYIDYGIYGNGIAKLHWSDPRCKKIIHAYDKESDLIALCGINRTRVQINKMIRKKYGLSGIPKAGERLICLKNNKNVGVMNGQIGTLVAIGNIGKRFYDLQMKMDGLNFDLWLYSLKDAFGKPHSKDAYAESNMLETKLELGDEIEKKMRQEMPDYYMGLDEKRKMRVDLFDFGYCVSVHKSQGSEWKRVIMFDERNMYQSDDDYTRWLYTGITRAKEKLIIIEDF
jgi:exodeoxyribonuclease-5